MSRARILAFLLALLTLLPAGLPGPALYLCRMMDRVSDTCCCGSRSESPALGSEAQARSPDCCERLKQGWPTALAARQELSAPLSLLGLPAPPHIPVLAAAQRDLLS